MATATVFKASDTTIIGYRLSDNKGAFKLTSLPLNINLRLVITFVGYDVIRRTFTLSDNAKEIDLGHLYLTPSDINLEEVLVVSERPPIVVRKDTVEFNASSFKTLPNAVVEDLLKKLPGVDVDKDGNITVNGKPVNRIMVDGKSFFGSDPKMASRNLPAQTIDKVQVSDDKEQMLRNGDDNPDNAGKVINLTFKKGFNKGVFGKAYGGYGTSDRYEAGLISNFFRDTLQFSILGYSNNLNKPGFGYREITQTGGLDRNQNVRSDRNSTNNYSNFGSSITINGINFGGVSQSGGITTSNGAGININHSPNKKKSFYAQYFYSGVKTDIEQWSRTTINNNDSLLIRKNSGPQKILNGAHIAGIGLNLRPDSTTTLIATANYIISRQDNDALTFDTLSNNYKGLISLGQTSIAKDENNKNYDHYLSLTKLSSKKSGRKYALTHTLYYNNKVNDTYTNSAISYQLPSVYDSLFVQLRNEKIPLTRTTIYGNYTEPITKKINFKLGGRYEFEKMHNRTSVFEGVDKNSHGSSSLFTRNVNRLWTSAGLEFIINKDLRINPNVRYQYQRFNNELSYLPVPVLQKQHNVLPSVYIIFKHLNINYNRDVVLPSYLYLIPVQNNSNPYYIQLGNPHLLPTLQDQLTFSIYNYSAKKYLNVWGYANLTSSSNDVIQNIQMDERGVQTILPVNADGTKAMRVNFGVNKQYKPTTKFSSNWYIGTFTSYESKKFIFNELLSRQKTMYTNWWAGFGLNWNDKFEINNSGSFGYQSLKNTNTYFQPNYTHWLNAGTELVLRRPKHVIWETQLSYNYNSAITDRDLRSTLLWKAAINFTMFKDERGVLRIAANDILNQLNFTFVNAYQNTIRTFHTNTLGRYFLVTYTYNIRKSGAKGKVGGQWSLW